MAHRERSLVSQQVDGSGEPRHGRHLRGQDAPDGFLALKVCHAADVQLFPVSAGQVVPELDAASSRRRDAHFGAHQATVRLCQASIFTWERGAVSTCVLRVQKGGCFVFLEETNCNKKISMCFVQ